MQNSKRALMLILTGMLAISGASCGGDSPDVVTDAPTDEATTVTTSGPVETKPTDDLPSDLDFGGTVINIIAEDPSVVMTRKPNLDVAEMDGEVFNDSVYKRNRALESRLNILLNETYPGGTTSRVRSNVLAGDDDIDLACVVDRDALNLYTEGAIHSYADLPHLDLTKAYWDQGTLSGMTIAGEALFAYGGMNMTAYGYTNVLAYNKKLADDNSLPDLYAAVYDGKWTFDLMASCMKTAHNDVNGNGTYDDGDVFGMTGRGDKSIPPMWIAAGTKTVHKNDDDIPVYTAYQDEKFQTVFLRIYDIYKANNYFTSVKPDPNGDVQADYFLKDGSLFFGSDFNSLGRFLRGMKSDFGVLPYPKYDEEQENYYSRVEVGFPNVVPVTCTKLEAVGAFLEAGSCSGYNDSVPAYYETVLKNKVSRDDDTPAMLDLIFNTRTLDLGDTYWYATIRAPFADMLDNGGNEIASKSQSVKSAADGIIAEVVAKVKEVK